VIWSVGCDKTENSNVLMPRLRQDYRVLGFQSISMHAL
jgi:hypothetical protein